MLETSARLLRLLSLLQSRREWTGPELAQRLEVSERTVRNDIERLRALGYPVLANRGSVGGYRLGAGAQLPPLLLDDEEAVATVLGLRAATGLAGVEEVSVRALAKVERVLPPRLRRRVAALAEYAVRVPDDTPAPQVDAEVLTTLAAACRDTERLRFEYRTHSGGEARREVEPYRLIAWGRRWYLLAWDVERGDWRTFRADRITPRVPTGPRFAPRPLPADDITAYLSGRVSAAAWRYRAAVLVHAPAAEVAPRIPAAAGHVEAQDADTCVLHTGSDSLDGLAVHLGLLGLDFTVTEPPELVDRIAALAGRYTRAIGSRAVSIRVRRHVEAFNAAVRDGRWAVFAERFTPDAEMRFVGVPAGPFAGRTAIADAYAQQPPTETLQALRVETDGDVDVVAFAWASGGTGTMRLEWDADQVAVLEIAFTG